MKQIHPRPHPLVLVDTRGKERQVFVFFKPDQPKMHLEIDRHNHQAWNRRTEVNVKISEVERFRNRYAGLEV